MTDPTLLQTQFVHDLQRQLRLSNALRDAHCLTRFGRPFAELSRQEVSALIDELKAWKAIPAELQRAAGQRDLF